MILKPETDEGAPALVCTLTDAELAERGVENGDMFQQARQDPKVKVDASIALGRSFLEAGYLEEAIETLQAVIDEYQLKGDDRSKEMYYWQARALEQKGNVDLAIKRYSQVAQWEFTYKDVQTRIKQLRAPVR